VGAVNDEEGLATSVVFNTYPSLSIDTDEGTVTLGAVTAETVNVSPPAMVRREFDSDGAAGQVTTRETAMVFLPAGEGSNAIDFVPEQTVVSHMTVTWGGKVRQILAVEPAQIGETVVGWKIYTEL